MTVEIFRRGAGISQRRPIFTAKDHFRSPFCSCEMRKWGCEMALVCQSGVLQLRNGALAAKLSFWGPWMVSQKVSQLRNEGLGCEMTLVCEKKVSQLRKFWQKRAMGLRNCFAEEDPFRSKPLISQRVPFGCEIISQRMVVFAGGYFGLRNFAGHWNFLFLSSFWLPETFLHLFCNSS